MYALQHRSNKKYYYCPLRISELVTIGLFIATNTLIILTLVSMAFLLWRTDESWAILGSVNAYVSEGLNFRERRLSQFVTHPLIAFSFGKLKAKG